MVAAVGDVIAVVYNFTRNMMQTPKIKKVRNTVILSGIRHCKNTLDSTKFIL
jgi:hypothetical protein